jgi:hypothetical protein
MSRVPYRPLVGSLMYAMVSTRPDIAFAVTQAARYGADPTRRHWTGAKRIVRYLKGTQRHGITYVRDEPFEMTGFADSDFGGDVDTRRSTGGFVFNVQNGPLAWCSKLARPVSLSSTEAELVALTLAGKEALWLRKCLRAFAVPCPEPLKIFEDNQACMAIASNQRGMSARTKHIATKYFAIRQWIEDGEIVVDYIPSADQLADIFTKPLCAEIFTRLVKAMGMEPLR